LTPPQHLLVSIHDVTPALAANVTTLWQMCRAQGVVPALLVVPNWHGEWPLEGHPKFVEWVRGCAGAGAEIFLHGERHDEVGLPRTWRDVWRAWGKTAREGEFLTLEEPAARERIDRGVALLQRLGLPPIGFVPPAWLARESCVRAVSAAGLQFSEDDESITVHARGERLLSPVVRWSGRTPMRARGSTLVAAARWRLQHEAPHMRIALHPSDLDHLVTARSVAQWLARWAGARTPSRYADLP
jgi:predicted deacetylase